MNRLLTAGALVLALSACTKTQAPQVVALDVLNVTVPQTTSSVEPLRVEVRAGNLDTCMGMDHRLTLVSRTAQALTLRAEATRRFPALPCPAVYLEGTLSYTDPGTPARTNPFEVIVNGKSWGRVEVQ